MKIFIATVKPYSRYRAGQPWAGVVVRKEVFHAAESRYGVDMRAGLFEGTAERGGRLYVEAGPGDVIAWGQQSIRYNDTGEKHGRVRPDGSVESLPDKAAAYRLLDAAAAMTVMKDSAEDPPAGPVQPVVPEDIPAALDNPAPQTVPADPPADPVQPVVPEDAAPEPEAQETSGDPVQPAVPLARFARPMGGPDGEPEGSGVVNPFGHD